MNSDDTNFLIEENKQLKNLIQSLKLEIRTQRKEIAALREERRLILDQDKGPNCITWKEHNN